MGNAVLFSEMTPDKPWEDEFNSWYDTEHIPIRMKVPGFGGAQRYCRNERDYLAIYEMDSAAALQSDAYREVKDNPSPVTARMLRDVSNFTRYIGDQISLSVNESVAAQSYRNAPVLYPVFFNVPKERLQEFDAWYDEDHIPALMGCADWWAVRRFDLVDAHPKTFNRLALHYLGNEEALSSKARDKARSTEWRDRLACEPWFKGTYMIFRKHGERFTST